MVVMMVVVVAEGWRGEQERARRCVGLRAHHFHPVHRHPLQGVGGILAWTGILSCGCINV